MREPYYSDARTRCKGHHCANTDEDLSEVDDDAFELAEKHNHEGSVRTDQAGDAEDEQNEERDCGEGGFGDAQTGLAERKKEVG